MAVAHLGWQRATEALTEAGEALKGDPACYDAKVAEGRAVGSRAPALILCRGLAASRHSHPSAVHRAAKTHILALRYVLLWKAGKRDDGVAELRDRFAD